jgi:DUF917 family protein
MNGLRPLLTSIHYDVATIDGDYMGRAYPRIYHSTTYSKLLSYVSIPPNFDQSMGS